MNSTRVQPVTRRARLAAMILASTLVASGCGDDPSNGVSTPDSVDSSLSGKAARLARDIDARREAIRRIESSDLHELVLKEIQGLHEDRAKRVASRLPDWSWTRGEIRSYLTLNGIDPGDDFELAPGQGPVEETPPLEVMKFYAKELAARGVDLLVVPVPKRLQVYPDRLPGIDDLGDFLGADLGYEQALLELAEAGVEVIDILPAFLAARYDNSGKTDERLFLDHNPHWTPRGAALAADVVAARVREFSWFEQGPTRAGVDIKVKREEITYQLPAAVPEDAEEQVIWIRRVLDKRGNTTAVNDRRSPILWLGDSFTGWYRKESGDFLRLLYVRLGHRFDNVSGDGYGSDALWVAVRRRRDALQGKRLVVWMFTAGTLSSRRLQKIDAFGTDKPR